MNETATLTERERHILDHLRHAQELGSTLKDYAAVFNVDVVQLYSGKAQLQRKGLWPATAKSTEVRRTELLAVQVTTEPVELTAGPDSELLKLRLTSPDGWMLECDRWPDPKWLMAVMGCHGAAL